MARLTKLTNLLGYIRKHPVGRMQPAQTVARMVAWQVRSRLKSGLLPVQWCNDSTLLASAGMNGVTGNIYYGLHEFSEMACIALFLRDGDLFADVGANAGTYTILASKVAGARTIAFEPGAGILPILEAQIRENHIADKVTVLREAAGARIGTVRFSTGLDTMNHVVESNRNGVEVSMTTLDKALGGETPIAMKLDIEGGEPEAIKGARSVLHDDHLRLLLVETTDNGSDELLAGAGFAEYTFDPMSRSLKPGPRPDGTNNRLFVRDPEFVRARIRSAPNLRVVGLRL